MQSPSTVCPIIVKRKQFNVNTVYGGYQMYENIHIADSQIELIALLLSMSEEEAGKMYALYLKLEAEKKSVAV